MIMEASELVPALCSRLHPAPRVFVLTSALAPEKSGLLRGKTVRPLQRTLETAAECGCLIEEAPHYIAAGTGATSGAPDVIIFDGSAVLLAANSDKNGSNGKPAANGKPALASVSTSGGAPDLDAVRELRAQPELDAVTFIALISERLTGAQLFELQEAGAGAFLSEEASALEVASRIQSAVELSRARAEIAELRAQITRGLRVDDVTGVMTRRFFFSQAHRECARARRYGHPLSCLMVEVDHYRMLCARYSDGIGEAVLRSIASVIGQWTRDSDIVARFAESKFVVLLPETDLDGATAVREKLLNALLEQPWRRDAEEIPVTISVGESQLQSALGARANAQELSESDDMGETALSTREAMAGLLEDADAALSIARKGARVPIVFVPQMFVETPVLGSAEE